MDLGAGSLHYICANPAPQKQLVMTMATVESSNRPKQTVRTTPIATPTDLNFGCRASGLEDVKEGEDHGVRLQTDALASGHQTPWECRFAVVLGGTSENVSVFLHDLQTGCGWPVHHLTRNLRHSGDGRGCWRIRVCLRGRSSKIKHQYDGARTTHLHVEILVCFSH